MVRALEKAVFQLEKKSGIKGSTNFTLICNNHKNAITYPSEYKNCPSCARKKDIQNLDQIDVLNEN